MLLSTGAVQAVQIYWALQVCMALLTSRPLWEGHLPLQHQWQQQQQQQQQRQQRVAQNMICH
jgi:hypothetical protein